MDVSDHFSWRDTGRLLPVRQQLKTLWCYAVVGTEAVGFLVGGNQAPIDLSAQEIIDSLHIHYPPKDKTQNPDLNCYNNVFSYIRDNGVCFASDYPLTWIKGDPKPTNDKRKVKIERFRNIDVSKVPAKVIEDRIKIQPVAGMVHVYESLRAFDGQGLVGVYMGARLNEKRKEKDAELRKAKHAVLVTGFGLHNGVKYYEIKNSWGEAWGESGYAKIRRELVTRISYPEGPVIVSPDS